MRKSKTNTCSLLNINSLSFRQPSLYRNLSHQHWNATEELINSEQQGTWKIAGDYPGWIYILLKGETVNNSTTYGQLHYKLTESHDLPGLDYEESITMSNDGKSLYVRKYDSKWVDNYYELNVTNIYNT